MTKIIKILLITIASSFIFTMCHGDLESNTVSNYTFYIQNNSKDTIAYTFSNLYPDNSLQKIDGTTIIYPYKKNKIDFQSYLLPNFQKYGILEIFIINFNTIQKYSWQEIASKYLITRRYDLTLDSIKKLDSLITYP